MAITHYVHFCDPIVSSVPGGPGATPIDYTSQLQTAISLITALTADINAHDVVNQTNNAAVISKLASLERVGTLWVDLARESNASQEQIKLIIKQINDYLPTIVSTIQGLQSAALDSLESMTSTIQREFDETQFELRALSQTVNDLLAPQELVWFTDRVNIDATLSSVTVTVPNGAANISAYIVGSCVPFIANDKVYAKGEQIAFETQTYGSKRMVYGETVMVFPIGSKAQVSYQAYREIGPIAQQGGGTWSVSDVEQLMQVPTILDGSGY